MKQETGNRQPATGKGLAVLRIASKLPKTPGGRHVSVQLIRSATGAGANYDLRPLAGEAQELAAILGASARTARANTPE